MTTHPTSLQSPGAAQVELGLTKYLDPLRIPPVHKAHDSLEIKMQATRVRLHSQLPKTPVWAYDGHFPGPTIEVRSGRRLRVAWRNEITGAYPAPAVDVDILVDGRPNPNLTLGAGRDGATPRAEVEALPPWTVVHLHGARTGAGNDGWTDNAVLRGLAQLAEYPNDQPSTTMWYHDHAMAVTALNVFAGLAGMYLIRDAEEDALHLPRGEREIPLIVCDRNLDTDENGEYTGDLLYKRLNVPLFSPIPDAIEDHVPATGPFTLVNGVIWPHLDVEPRWYRFRMLNASNYREYTFELRDEHGAPVNDALYQIGSDQGLLPVPAALPHGLTLDPGERADVLIDFRAFRGKALTLVNTAPVLATLINSISANPDVMQFRVRSRDPHDDFKLPATLSPSFERLTHESLPEHHKHRWLALTGLEGQHPEMWEMEELEAKDVPPVLPLDGIVQVEVKDPHDGTTKLKTLKRVTRDFKDAATFYVEQDSTEQWNIINLTSGFATLPHPVHVHLIRFQALEDRRDIRDVTPFGGAPGQPLGGTTSPILLNGTPPKPEDERTPGEKGWKDTIVVRPGELLPIVGEFSGGSGRYMYHCHILEHEDHGMMGTFVVMPEKVMPFDTHPGHDSHDHDH
ncbi:MAG: hypothetical protein QOD83_3154 [Solirubrobacteraceae bacterium]|nr:hypothetical protein [Solirubrobacteraceae bacterium]